MSQRINKLSLIKFRQNLIYRNKCCLQYSILMILSHMIYYNTMCQKLYSLSNLN